MTVISDGILSTCRDRLSAMRETLEKQIALGKDATATVDLDQSKIGRLSRVDALQQQQMARSTMANNEKRLRQVLAALHRCENQTYGECIGCGEFIAESRLLAQPEVERCIDCQQTHEAK